ncbi:MAG: DUF721 domain-containing protein [Spirochaetales bacterium]|jgi:hypothetical protein
MADSRIKSVSELLSSFFDQDLVKKGELYSGFGRSWKTIAGSRLGEHSRPVDIRRGILIVEAEHQGWMQLLQLQQDKILEEIERKFPDLKISGIAFKLGNPAAPQVVSALSGPTATAPGPASGLEPETEAEKVANDTAGGKEALPPDMVAMFARIKKNIKK